MGRRGPAWAIAAALLFGAAAGRADDAPGTLEPAAPPIDVYVIGPDALPRVQGALAAVKRPLHWVALDAMDRTQVTQPPSVARAGGARVWIDCSDPARARLYFANWTTGRFLLREVPLPSGLDALSLETLAQMIESSLDTLIADRGAGMNRAEMGLALGERPPPPGTPPAKATVDGATVEVAVGAFYGAQAFAAAWPVEHGPGIAMSVLQRSGRARLGGWATVQYQLPETIATSLAGVRLDTVALRFGPELDLPISGDAVMTVRAGVGGDVIQVAARQGTGGAASLAAARTTWDFMGQLAIGATWRLPSRIELAVAAVVDADFVLRHYDVDVDGRPVRIVTPWRVRPGLVAGLSWH